MKKPLIISFCLVPILFFCSVLSGQEPESPKVEEPIRFNKNFSGAAVGKIELVAENDYRCSIDGQYNQYGRNRQPSWFYFRLDNVRDKTVTLRLTNFNGEYNNRPVRPNWSRDCPLISFDNVHWQKADNPQWDAEKGELSFTVTAKTDSFYVTYIPPYVEEHLNRLMDEIDLSPFVLNEVIGKTLQKRDIHCLTITDFHVPDADKKHYWIVARLHAWESFTSFIADALVRYLVEEKNLTAAQIRREAITHVVVMPDPDGCEAGMVRFNLNGFDLNRNWSGIDLRSRESLRDRPEVWYLKKAILASNREKKIDVIFNLHDHQTGYDLLETNGGGDAYLAWYKAFESKMENPPVFMTNPKTRGRIYSDRSLPPKRTGSMDEIWNECGIPHVLIEFNINRKGDTDYYLTLPDAAINGQRLIQNIHFAEKTD